MQPTDAVEEPVERVITAAEAHQRKMPFSVRNYFPIGRDPQATIRHARSMLAASVGGPLGAIQPPALPIEELLNFVVDADDDD